MIYLVYLIYIYLIYMIYFCSLLNSSNLIFQRFLAKPMQAKQFKLNYNFSFIALIFRTLFKYQKNNKLAFLESHKQTEYYNGKYFRKQKEEEFKLKKRKIRIFNFLSKIATVDMIAKISIFSSDENRFFRFFFFCDVF